MFSPKVGFILRFGENIPLETSACGNPETLTPELPQSDNNWLGSLRQQLLIFLTCKPPLKERTC